MQLLALHRRRRPAGGNPNGSATGCSRSPPPWSAGSRQVRLRYAGHHPWVTLLIGALTALTTLDST